MLEIKRRSFDLISFKLAAEVSSKMVGDFMAPVFSQISPDAVGSDWRDLQVALHYGVRLVAVSENAPSQTVKHLVEHYPSHDFVIDNEEAERLFNNVREPSPFLYDIMEYLFKIIGDSAFNENSDGIVIALTNGCKDEPAIKDSPDGKDDPQTQLEEEKLGKPSEPDEVVETRNADRPSDA
jgi:hypothetical protein